MGFRFLRQFRIGFSLLVFILVTFLFIDFGNNFSGELIGGILYLQFVPSLMKFFQVAGWLSVGFAVVLILTWLFGRVYCSFLCPLGILQDIIRFFTAKFRRKKMYKFHKPDDLLRYSLFGFTLIFLLGGSVFLVNLLDPYSVFGKIGASLFRPVYYMLNNLAAWLLTQINVYALFRVELKSYSWASFGYSVMVAGLITWLVYRYGRLYCNTVCPVGTLLGLVARFSVFRISLDQETCTSCGICGTNCKSGCIDTKQRTIDFDRCVGCMNCLTSCSSGGVKFTSSHRIASPQPGVREPDSRRRDFIRHGAVITTTMAAITKDAFSEGLLDGKKPVVRTYPVALPGSFSIDRFVNSCTACHLCVSACPTHVIQPSILQYGIAGLFQPHMDYLASFCNFECVICTEVCPTGALLPIGLEEKKLTQLGISKFIRENCVVYTDEKACGACSEHCPTKAVNMVFYKEKLKIPEVDEKICIGCGACEYACPTMPKSIYVDGNRYHKPAEKPKIEKTETEVNPEDDFPF